MVIYLWKIYDLSVANPSIEAHINPCNARMETKFGVDAGVQDQHHLQVPARKKHVTNPFKNLQVGKNIQKFMKII